MIYVVIPVFNRWGYTNSCLRSLAHQTFTEYQVVVVDHGSTDGTSENIRKTYPNVIVLRGDDSMWWTAATNVGVQFAIENNARFVLTLNNDLIVDVDYLKTLIEFYHENPNSLIGSVSCDINNPQKIVFSGNKWMPLLAKYQSACDNLQPYSSFIKKYNLIEADLLPGRGTLIPIQVFHKFGLFNSISFPHYMADEDLSLRAKRGGYKLYINPKSVVFSHVEATGLNNIHKQKNFKYWKDMFTSIRSPNNFKVRWNWAHNHTKIPFLYFFVDYGRILLSQLTK